MPRLCCACSSRATVRKNFIVPLWLALVTPHGSICGWTCSFFPIQPRKLKRPKANSTAAVPPSRAIRLKALHKTASVLALLPTKDKMGNYWYMSNPAPVDLQPKPRQRKPSTGKFPGDHESGSPAAQRFALLTGGRAWILFGS